MLTVGALFVGLSRLLERYAEKSWQFCKFKTYLLKEYFLIYMQQNTEEAWHKLNCSPQEALLIVADTDEGPEFCHLATQVVAAGEGLVVYIDDNFSRRQKAANLAADIKTATLEQLKELKAAFTEGYGFTKAIVISNRLATCITQVIDSLAKGSVLMLRSQDPQPPILDFSTNRLHYDQMTIVAG